MGILPTEGGSEQRHPKKAGVHPVPGLGLGRSLHGPATCSWNAAGQGQPGTPASGCSTSLSLEGVERRQPGLRVQGL